MIAISSVPPARSSHARAEPPIWWLQLRRTSLLLALTAKAFGPLLLRRFLRRPVDVREVAVRVRGLLERMGLTYVKLGQFLATRYDLLPREVSDELGRLFQRAEPMPLAEVLAQIEAGLGRPAADVFAVFEEQPLGSASVAQVHRAQRHDGRWVAVKVQRLGVQQAFEADMRSLGLLVEAIAATRLQTGFDVKAAAQEFAAYTVRELDFRVEATTAERVRGQGDRSIVVPRVHAELSCRTILTLDLIRGVSLSEVYARMDAGAPAPPGLAEAAETLAQAIFRQLFIAGFFHGDPHPGNIMLTEDGQVALVDFGIFGALDSRQLADVRGYIQKLALGDAARAYDYYARMVAPTRWSDMEGFRSDAVATLEAWQAANADPATPRQEVMISTVADRLLTILRRHNVALRLETLLFWRAVILLDANFARPELAFDLNASLQRFFGGQEHDLGREIGADLLRPRTLEAISDLRLRSPAHAGRLLERPREIHARRASVPSGGEPVRWIAGAVLALGACAVAGAVVAR